MECLSQVGALLGGGGPCSPPPSPNTHTHPNRSRCAGERVVRRHHGPDAGHDRPRGEALPACWRKLGPSSALLRHGRGWSCAAATSRMPAWLPATSPPPFFPTPQDPRHFTLHDLKRARPLAGTLFNVLFNLSKFMAYETRDPFVSRQARDRSSRAAAARASPSLGGGAGRRSRAPAGLACPALGVVAPRTRSHAACRCVGGPCCAAGA
jgi:hypothetical protein